MWIYNRMQLKGAPLLEVNPIERRANCKIVTLSGRHFLVGGITADAISNQIYEFRLNHQSSPARLEWRQLHFPTDLFSPRNSFACCASPSRIYLWGGLEIVGSEQRCLSDLVEIDPLDCRMRRLPLANPLPIHSASLQYDPQHHQLVGYGGSDETGDFPAYLYRLPLTESPLYQWQRTLLKCASHQGFIWQHAALLSNSSFFTKTPGSFLTVVGGCRFPHSPYPAIVEFDLQKGEQTNETHMAQGLVSHDCVERDGKLYIFGGATGGDFSAYIHVLTEGTVKRLTGPRAIGCTCCVLEGKLVVYGGVCGTTSINGAFIYE